MHEIFRLPRDTIPLWLEFRLNYFKLAANGMAGVKWLAKQTGWKTSGLTKIRPEHVIFVGADDLAGRRRMKYDFTRFLAHLEKMPSDCPVEIHTTKYEINREIEYVYAQCQVWRDGLLAIMTLVSDAEVDRLWRTWSRAVCAAIPCDCADRDGKIKKLLLNLCSCYRNYFEDAANRYGKRLAIVKKHDIYSRLMASVSPDRELI